MTPLSLRPSKKAIVENRIKHFPPSSPIKLSATLFFPDFVSVLVSWSFRLCQTFCPLFCLFVLFYCLCSSISIPLSLNLFSISVSLSLFPISVSVSVSGSRFFCFSDSLPFSLSQFFNSPSLPLCLSLFLYLFLSPTSRLCLCLSVCLDGQLQTLFNTSFIFKAYHDKMYHVRCWTETLVTPPPPPEKLLLLPLHYLLRSQKLNFTA